MKEVGAIAVCRTLTSAWIETSQGDAVVIVHHVALSRVRGLKQRAREAQSEAMLSHSHECVD